MIQKIALILAVVGVTILLLGLGCSSIERKMLFFPSHHPSDGGLAPWVVDGRVIGYCRPVKAPENVWLMMHGNGGQAAGRNYAIPSFSAKDAVFVLEYPGYGSRDGVPGEESFNRAASEAYLHLRATHTNVPVCVAGESIGSGPASFLATILPPPDKIVLIVPYGKLSEVVKDRFPCFIMDLVLKNNWDNLAALAKYKGPVEIFGAESDGIIDVRHARALAAGVQGSKFVLIRGGHNEWSDEGKVRIRNP
ncbi:MAG: alpha/beta hydrolase [bacterium]